MSEYVRSKDYTVTTVGGAGAAVGSVVTDELDGFLLDVYLNFNAGAPATTDTTIAYTSPSLGTVLVVTNSATDGLYAPRQATHTAAGAATGLYDLYPLNGTLTISLAGCDALTGAVVATVRWLSV